MTNPMVDRDAPRVSGGILRCATYVRTGIENARRPGLTALDAQRELCAACIRDRLGGSWIASFEDHGFPGVSLHRPAVKRLLGNIDAGAIDAVVVPHVDRLTRSPGDLARLLTRFQDAGVSLIVAVGPSATRYAANAGLGARGGTAP
jgi:DNA invertase Pin-like site-specific DNA recombinase